MNLEQGRDALGRIFTLRIYALRILTRRNLGVAFLFILFVWLTPDAYNPPPGVEAALEYRYSVSRWEVSNLPAKWLNIAYGFARGRDLDRAQKLEVVDEYLEATRLAWRQERRLEGIQASVGGASAGGGGRERVEAARAHLREHTTSRDSLRPLAEEVVEAELDAVLTDAGFGSRLGFLFPPVDLTFQVPPTILNMSRRDNIEVVDQIFTVPDMPPIERDRIEREILDTYDLSAFVDNLAGLSTYPTIVTDQTTLRSVLRTAVHEWLHVYFFFRPLGRNYWVSPEMSSLNEAVADLVGNELGDAAYVRMGGDLSVAQSRYVPRHELNPFFTEEMRETRRTVDEMLADGKVEEAEEYMRERWWRLRLGGYRLRKLNQAYFAFRGRYDGPASVSPIGPQARALRAHHPDIASFIKAIEQVSSYEEFLDLLRRMGIGPDAQ